METRSSIKCQKEKWKERLKQESKAYTAHDILPGHCSVFRERFHSLLEVEKCSMKHQTSLRMTRFNALERLLHSFEQSVKKIRPVSINKLRVSTIILTTLKVDSTLTSLY